MAVQRVIALMGPTASGKTSAALAVADRGRFDLVSVDSAMVYRRMDIGTAKPSPEILAQYPHALVDIIEPAESYSAARFVADADAAVAQAFAAGRTPLLVGGTMLYFRAFKHGLSTLPAADRAIRRRIAAQASEVGWPTLHARLARRDAKAAAHIDPNNGQRIQRALEVLEVTGRSITEAWSESVPCATERLDCELVEVAVVPDRATLHESIACRVDAMLARGLVAEVAALRDDAALTADLPSMRAVGYRQVWRHLDGEYDRQEMVERIRAATRQLAKRQLTWLRRWPGLARTVDGEAAANLIATEAARP
ncbi:MAG: tRNA (adenosine(37)-N6)-dimethylallyltransferase MiaA [Gammaproteobacteria bacterium]|nr:tRNA (adenosine(37)-N6)-dimethylallyltransferase MiaA [Gammaproteobacteria bacterium]